VKSENYLSATSIPFGGHPFRHLTGVEHLFLLPAEKLQDCVNQLNQSNLPPLWRPRADQFLHVQSLPYLGTGKLDLRRMKEVALKGSE
jgi:hypothetical protein